MSDESLDEAQKMAQIARAVVLAIAQNEGGDPVKAGVSIDVEAKLKRSCS